MKNKRGKRKANATKKSGQNEPARSNTSEENYEDRKHNNDSGKKSENTDKNSCSYKRKNKILTSQQKSEVSEFNGNDEDKSVAGSKVLEHTEESQKGELSENKNPKAESENTNSLHEASGSVISKQWQDGAKLKNTFQHVVPLPDPRICTDENTNINEGDDDEHAYGVENLKKVVFCEVCRQVYADPRKLICSHTFCSGCLLKGTSSQNYACPQCHIESTIKEVIKDVQKQAIVKLYKNYIDLFENSDENPANTSVNQNKKTVICGMCDIKQKPVKSKCIECNQNMCYSCENTHNGVSICKQHTVRPIDFDIREAQKQLKSIVDQLQDRKMQADTLFSMIQDYTKKLTEVYENNLESIAKVFKFLIGRIEDDHLALLGKIRSAEDKLLSYVQINQLMLSSDFSTLTCLVTTFGVIANRNDLSLLTYAIKNARFMLKTLKLYNVEDVQETLPQYHQDHGKFSIGKGIDLQKYAFIVLSPVFTFDYNKDLNQQNADGKVMFCGILVDLLNYKYDEVCRKTLIYTPKRISLMEQRLLCLTEGTILVYNDTTLIQSIKNKYARNVTGLAQLESGKMVLACNNDNGIKVIKWTKTSNSVEQITTGNFSDVCIHKNIIYGLEYCKKKLIWYKYGEKKWEVIGRLALSYANPYSEDRLLVNDTGVYISSFCNQSIFWLPSVDDSCLGFTVIASTRDHRILNSLYLCDVDDTGKILLAGKDSLKVFEKSTNTCRDVVLPGLSCPPIDAVVTEDGSSVFILTKDSNQLLKYDRFQ